MARNTVSPRLGIPIPVGSGTRKGVPDARDRKLELTGASVLFASIANGRMVYCFASEDLTVTPWLIGSWVLYTILQDQLSVRILGRRTIK